MPGAAQMRNCFAEHSDFRVYKCRMVGARSYSSRATGRAIVAGYLRNPGHWRLYYWRALLLPGLSSLPRLIFNDVAVSFESRAVLHNAYRAIFYTRLTISGCFD